MIRGSWMTGGSVEATLELWASSLRDVKGRIGPLFQQARTAHSAALFLDALLGPERRKTGWMRAEAGGGGGGGGGGAGGARGPARARGAGAGGGGGGGGAPALLGARLCP